MDAVLQKQLTMQIEQQLEAKVLDVKAFTIPYSIVDVTYTPIIKKRMDILMKMLLNSYRSGVFTDAEQLASILMVEPLFINDLTKQMERSKLIAIDDTVTLTAKGEQQLADGIYEEQMPDATTELMYSTLHEQYFDIHSEELELLDDLPDPLHYFEDDESVQLKEELVMQSLQQQLVEQDSDQLVQAVHMMDIVELYDFPISLFICYDKKNDRLFSRAFNIYVNEWDDTVSSFMDKKEVVQWREQFLS